MATFNTQWDVKGSTMEIGFALVDGERADKGEVIENRKFTLNLEPLGYSDLPDVGKEALAYGAFTSLRNQTGRMDKTPAGYAEACANLQERISGMEAGDWGSERAPSATPFTAKSILARAIERASAGAMDAAKGAEFLCAQAEALSAKGLESTDKVKGWPSAASFAEQKAEARDLIRRAVDQALRKARPQVASAAKDIRDEEELARIQKRRGAAKPASAPEPFTLP